MNRLLISIYVAVKFVAAKRDIDKRKFERALRKLQAAYRVAGFDKNFEKAPIDLNVTFCQLAIWTNNLLLARDLSATIGRQIRSSQQEWNDIDYSYLRFYSDALILYCESWLVGRGVKESNPAYIAFNKDAVSPGIRRRFPLAEDGRLK